MSRAIKLLFKDIMLTIKTCKNIHTFHKILVQKLRSLALQIKRVFQVKDQNEDDKLYSFIAWNKYVTKQQVK